MVKRTGKKRHSSAKTALAVVDQYGRLMSDISGLLEEARRGAARTVNAILTATYWEIGRRIVEHEQGGAARAEYGEELLDRLSRDLTKQHGRGFSARNLRQMRTFFQGWEIWQTPSAKFEARAKFQTLPGKSVLAIWQTPSAKSKDVRKIPAEIGPRSLGEVFPLSWSHYVSLMAVEKPHARAFYESEAIRGGWSVRQLDRQIDTRFFERTAHSKNPAALLARVKRSKDDVPSIEDEIRNPYVLEFLGLEDPYTESQLEKALIKHLEAFLLELGAGFTFVARQKRIRIGAKWYRIDLLLFHRRLRCLVVIDLKLGRFTHEDAGQMNLYLNYVREHMMEPGENEPAGMILCTAKDDAVVHYAMGGIKAKVFASEYMMALPSEETLRREIVATQHALEARAKLKK